MDAKQLPGTLYMVRDAGEDRQSAIDRGGQAVARCSATLQSMSDLKTKPIHKPQRSSASRAKGVLQRQCACVNHTVADGDCESCQKDKSAVNLQRAAVNAE